MIGNPSPVSAMEQIVGQFVREELSAENAQIAGAIWAMLDAGGKRIRPRITMLAGQACNPGAPPDPVLASYMELIHVATLVHDDVLDDADLRRGRTSTNRTHGNRFSVLAGDYLFAWVFKKVTQAYANPIPTILAGMLSDICNGEVKQLRAAGDPALTQERYLEIIGKKTAELFAACAECGAIAALRHEPVHPAGEMREQPAVRALRAYGFAFGMAFQIRDDMLDFTSQEAVLGKPVGSDLREKKVTLPLIYALDDQDSTAGPLFRRLTSFADASAPEAAPTLEALTAEVRRGRAIARCQTALAGHVRAAQDALTPLAPSHARHELMGLTQTLNESLFAKQGVHGR